MAYTSCIELRSSRAILQVSCTQVVRFDYVTLWHEQLTIFRLSLPTSNLWGSHLSLNSTTTSSLINVSESARWAKPFRFEHTDFHRQAPDILPTLLQELRQRSWLLTRYFWWARPQSCQHVRQQQPYKELFELELDCWLELCNLLFWSRWCD